MQYYVKMSQSFTKLGSLFQVPESNVKLYGYKVFTENYFLHF